jgi:hypothetical protein
MWGITKNTWDYYQTYGLVPGMAQPMGKKTINKNNIYKFNHQKAMIPVSMMNAYGIRPNGSFAPGGLANENRRRREKYLGSNASNASNASRSQSPSIPEPPPPSPVLMNYNYHYNSNSPKSMMNEPVWNPNTENEEIKEGEGKITRSGRVLKPLSRMNYRGSNRKSRRTRKSRKARTRKA